VIWGRRKGFWEIPNERIELYKARIGGRTSRAGGALGPGRKTNSFFLFIILFFFYFKKLIFKDSLNYFEF
jgi:hypothetical protein